MAGANSANGTKVDLYTCNGTSAQQWTRTGTTFRAWQVPRRRAAGTANGTKVQLYDCNGSGAQSWTTAQRQPRQRRFGQVPGRHGLEHHGRQPAPDLTCGGTANQSWTLV